MNTTTVNISDQQVDDRDFPLPKVGKPVEYLVSNGYSVLVKIRDSSSFPDFEYARHRRGEHRDYIPFISGPNALELKGIRRLVVRGDLNRVRYTLRKVARLSPASQKGAVVANWSTDPRASLEAAIEWLTTRDRTSLLARQVTSAGSARQFLTQNTPADYGNNLKSEVESAGRQVRDIRMALADLVILRSLARLHNEHEARTLGLAEEDWKSGDDLTGLLLRAADRQTESRKTSNQREALEQAAQFIARDLHGNSSALTPLESKGMHLAKGASGIWNRLFRDLEARLRAPDDWAALEAFADRVRRSRTKFPILLWHGFGYRADNVLSAKVGEPLATPGGFLHTSMSSVIALQNSNLPPVLGQLSLPVNSRAMFLPGNRSEQEIVLPPGVLLRVRDRLEREVISGAQETTKCIVIVLDVLYPEQDERG